MGLAWGAGWASSHSPSWRWRSGAAAPSAASVCTLADHIRAANTNTAVGFCPAGTSHDIITLTDDLILSEPLPAITGTITIEGGGHTISGAGKFRIFDVNGGNLTIRNLTMRDGQAESGGALRLRGGAEVVISHATLSNNSATYGGAIAQSGGQPNQLIIESSSFLGNRAGWYGGALDVVRGAVAISKSSFIENYADDYGGVITVAGSAVRVENSAFHKNSAKHDSGALHVFSGEITLTHVTMTNNFLTSPYSAAGQTITKQVASSSVGVVNLYNSIVAGGGDRPDCFGGLDQIGGNLSPDGSCAYEPGRAPRLGELTGAPAYLPLLDNSPAVDAADPQFCLETDQIGTPRPQGGGCDIGAIESTTRSRRRRQPRQYAPCKTRSSRRTPIEPTDLARPGTAPTRSIWSAITSWTNRWRRSKRTSPIEGNGHAIDGNGRFRIFDVDGGKLTLNNATLTRGRGSRFGGAIRLQNGGTAIANDVQFIGNASREGGAIGGFFPVYIEVNKSRFIRNRGSLRGGAISMNGGGFARITNSSFVGNSSGGYGGAIGSMSGGLAVSNSTFIGNRARKGGALSLDGAGYPGNVPVARLTHVTMLDNHAREGEAIWTDRVNSSHDITLRLRNSLIAGADGGELCLGPLAQNLYNLIEDGSCSPMLSGDPMMQEPAESATAVAPRASSPAIDAGHPEVCPDADQLGRPRPLGNGCDLGAIEVMPLVAPLSDCRVKPTHNLNFRDGPWGAIIGSASYATTFTAQARTPKWFQVVDEAGRSGWISALYVRTDGDCG